MRLDFYRPFILAVLCFAAGTISAQQAVSPTATSIPADQQASKEDVLRLMDAMHARESTKTMMVNLVEQTDEMTDAMVDQQSGSLGPLEKAKVKHDIKQLNNDILTQVFNEQFIDSMIDDVVPVYQRHFTKADIDSIVGFYSSPAGKHFITEMPSLTLESMQAMMPKLEAQMKKINEIARKRADERLKEEEGDKKPAPPAKPPVRRPKPQTSAASPKKVQS